MGDRRLTNCTQHQIYYSGDQMKANRMGGTCRTYVGEEICVRVLVGEDEGKEPLGRHRRRWSRKFKSIFQEIGWDDLN